MEQHSGETRSPLVGHLRNGHPTVRNGGARTDTTKTQASRSVLTVPATVLPWLKALAGETADRMAVPEPAEEGRVHYRAIRQPVADPR